MRSSIFAVFLVALLSTACGRTTVSPTPTQLVPMGPPAFVSAPQVAIPPPTPTTVSPGGGLMVTLRVLVSGFPVNTKAGLAACWSEAPDRFTVNCPVFMINSVNDEGNANFGATWGLVAPPGRYDHFLVVVLPNAPAAFPPPLASGELPTSALVFSVPSEIEFPLR